MSEAETAEAAAPPLTLENHADLKAFTLLSLKNGLLNIVTLTLYRFWGRTEVRRRVWSATTLNGEAFEYMGRGVELFVGFLLALVALGLPFLLIIFGVQFLGPLGVLLIFLFYPFLFFLLGFGQYTAFRYLASRTAWRGVRFWVSGSAIRYGFIWLGYLLLTGITLGWFWPAASRRLSGRMWGHLEFGDRKLKFDVERARRRPVYRAFLIAWACGFGAYIVLGGVLATMGFFNVATQEPSLGKLVAIYPVVLLFGLAYAAIYAIYQAAALESVVHGLSFEGANFDIRISWRDMAILTVTNILIIGVTLGFLMPLVQARTARFLINRLRVSGGVDLDAISQTAQPGPRHGEGLADAFGLSPI